MGVFIAIAIFIAAATAWWLGRAFVSRNGRHAGAERRRAHRLASRPAIASNPPPLPPKVVDMAAYRAKRRGAPPGGDPSSPTAGNKGS